MTFRRVDSPAVVQPALDGEYAEDAYAPVERPAGLPDLLTVDRAADAVGVSRRTIYNWIAKGLVQTKTLASGRQRVVTASLFKGAA